MEFEIIILLLLKWPSQGVQVAHRSLWSDSIICRMFLGEINYSVKTFNVVFQSGLLEMVIKNLQTNSLWMKWKNFEIFRIAATD